MAYIPFDRLRANGYKVEAIRHPERSGTTYYVKKGDFACNRSVDDDYGHNDPRYLQEIENSIERDFQEAAKRKIKDMANMYNLPPEMYHQMQYNQMMDMQNGQRYNTASLQQMAGIQMKSDKEWAEEKRVAAEAKAVKDAAVKKKKQILLINAKKGN